MMKVVPRLEAIKMENFGALLPWNRRKRRHWQKGKKIVMHVFSGDNTHFWERKLSNSTTEVLCIDLEGGCRANFMDKHVYAYVLMLAASGRLRILLGGPPCRTVSALRSQDDGGPGELRSEEFPHGLPGLSSAGMDQVHNDSILFFRYLSLYLRRFDYLKIPRRSSSWNNHVILMNTEVTRIRKTTCPCFGRRSGDDSKKSSQALQDRLRSRQNGP